ncbi:MAG TPA: hypothetical protein VI457_08360 [Methylococcaceae bacterium]|nr:hypothetical protein [Methylococcaceae bacterium]
MRTFFCCLLFVALAAAAPVAYRYAKPIERAPATQEEIVAVPLDSPVYAASRDVFPDLRVFDEGAAETPFLVEKIQESRSESVRVHYAAEVASLRKLEGNRMEILVRLEKDAPAAEGLRVFTPLKNFENQVKVFGAQEGKDWQPLAEAVIYDYSRHMDVDNRDIPLPPNAYRRFKLVFDEATASRESEFLDLTRRQRQGTEVEREEQTRIQRLPLRIDRIEQWSNVVRELKAVDSTFDYAPASFEVRHDPETLTTWVAIATRREPLTGLTLQTSSRNFSRSATVQIPVQQGVQTVWRDIGSGTIQNLHFRAIDRERLTVSFPEQRQKTYRIAIRNEDNPPLEITGVQAKGVGYRLLFLAAPGSSYRLAYGAEQAERPRYETSAVLDTLRSGYRPVEARLGPETASPAAPPAGLDLQQVLNSKLFLGGAIVLMVLVLAGALLRAGKRMEQRPGDHE